MKIMYKGACEYEHFEFLYKLGIDSFILVNNPSLDTFISLKTIEKVIKHFKFKEIYFSDTPSSREGFEYYSSVIKPSGLMPKYIDDNENFFKEISDSNQLENLCSQVKKNFNGTYIVDLELFMESYRELDKEQFIVFFDGLER